MKFSHRLYKSVRPILADLGLLKIARRLLPDALREQIAARLGLAGFNIGTAAGNRIPSWRTSLQSSSLTAVGVEGVNIVGDLRADLGVSEFTRSVAKALNAVNIPTAYTEIAYRVKYRTTPLSDGLVTGSPYQISFVDLHFAEFYERVTNAPSEAFVGKYIIAGWQWELPRFVELSPAVYRLIDEIWVGSRFSQDAIAQAAPIPVLRMPPAIDVRPNANANRAAFGLPDDRFIFLFSFNAASAAVRKNPFGVIEAFRRAFGTNPGKALLVIKTQQIDEAENQNRDLARALRAAIEAVNGVVIHDNLTRQAMTDLMAVCDAYVSLHRAEGFGFGMAEAMALGKSVIGTNYSGNTDFMTLSNSYLVRYQLRPITDKDHQFQPEFAAVYPPGEIWAEPDLDDAARLMQDIVQDIENAQQVGARAASDIAAQLSPSAVGQRIAERLRTIGRTHT